MCSLVSNMGGVFTETAW